MAGGGGGGGYPPIGDTDPKPFPWHSESVAFESEPRLARQGTACSASGVARCGGPGGLSPQRTESGRWAWGSALRVVTALARCTSRSIPLPPSCRAERVLQSPAHTVLDPRKVADRCGNCGAAMHANAACIEMRMPSRYVTAAARVYRGVARPWPLTHHNIHVFYYHRMKLTIRNVNTFISKFHTKLVEYDEILQGIRSCARA
jgi:hypothetical protein